jgi:hypothetical protein
MSCTRPLLTRPLLCRPVRNGRRLTPSELNDHRITNDFLGPGCLCASQDPDPTAFSEAAIFQVTSGRLSGEWVAACAQHKCKYFRAYIQFSLSRVCTEGSPRISRTQVHQTWVAYLCISTPRYALIPILHLRLVLCICSQDPEVLPRNLLLERPLNPLTKTAHLHQAAVSVRSPII